jgi:hypothetical protein
MIEKTGRTLDFIFPLTQDFGLMYESGRDEREGILRETTPVSLFRLDLSTKCVQKLHTIKNHDFGHEIFVDAYNPLNFVLEVNDEDSMHICKVENNRIVVDEVIQVYDSFCDDYFNGCLYFSEWFRRHQVYGSVSSFSGSI